jgi:formamidopyrimidine-DNA glycosylase
MPELPEVETYVRELAPLLQGRRVVGGELFWPRIIATPAPEAFIDQICGQTFVRFDRRGKFMLLGLQSGDTLIVHLRMTGHLRVHPATVAADKHTHVLLTLDNDERLHYQDPRKFGQLWLVTDPQTVLAKLGPEPLSAAFTVAALAGRVAGRQASIKALLLDQEVVAGVGNIYADEALFGARIHPARPGGGLTTEELARLHEEIGQVLQRAIDAKGSSLGASQTQNYRRPGGEPGRYQVEHQVYQRAGQPCLRCGTPIKRIVLAQRSAHFCPHCQQLGLQAI